MQKRMMLSIAMLVVGAAMLAAASVASPGAAQKGSSPLGSKARKGGILKFTLYAGIENIDPQRTYYVPEWQYEWLTARSLLNFAHATGSSATARRSRRGTTSTCCCECCTRTSARRSPRS